MDISTIKVSRGSDDANYIVQPRVTSVNLQTKRSLRIDNVRLLEELLPDGVETNSKINYYTQRVAIYATIQSDELEFTSETFEALGLAETKRGFFGSKTTVPPRQVTPVTMSVVVIGILNLAVDSTLAQNGDDVVTVPAILTDFSQQGVDFEQSSIMFNNYDNKQLPWRTLVKVNNGFSVRPFFENYPPSQWCQIDLTFTPYNHKPTKIVEIRDLT